uniref:FAS1 domain-containing protein n=1 Tax=Pseudo-nitzschia australis TaxID=44445 RepID=A0A7S4AFH9_9STRA
MVSCTALSLRRLAIVAILANSMLTSVVALTPQELEEKKNGSKNVGQTTTSANANEGDSPNIINDVVDSLKNVLKESSAAADAAKGNATNTTTAESVLCADKQFSIFCGLFNETKNNSTANRAGLADWGLNYHEPFTLFAPVNTAFLTPVVTILPPGLSVRDFFDTHILNRALSFEGLSDNCYNELKTRNVGETTKTYCEVDGTARYQMGKGNVAEDRPMFLSRSFVNIRAGNGFIHAIDAFIKPSQFLTGALSPNTTPSNSPNVSPTSSPSDVLPNSPSVPPTSSPSDVPSSSPSDLPTSALTAVSSTDSSTSSSTEASSASSNGAAEFPFRIPNIAHAGENSTQKLLPTNRPSLRPSKRPANANQNTTNNMKTLPRTRQNAIKGSSAEQGDAAGTTLESVLCGDKQFSIFCSLFNETKQNNIILGRAGLADWGLNYQEPFTLFAPVDNDFLTPVDIVLPPEFTENGSNPG